MINGGDNGSRSSAKAAPVAGYAEHLYLVGAATAGDKDTYIDGLVRTSLLSRHDAARRDPIPLRFGGTSFDLWDGENARTRYLGQLVPHSSANSVGGASIPLDDADRILALALRGPVPRGDRLQHLQTIQHLFGTAALVAKACGMERLYWPPAQLWSPTAPLMEAITSLEELGLPPILHIISFVESDALPASGALRTVGLSEFCGIEIALLHDERLPLPELIRRISRLVIHAMVAGPMQPGAVIAGLEPDETMTVGPVDDQYPNYLPIQLRHGR